MSDLPKVKLIDGLWVWWNIDERHLPPTFTVYSGSWGASTPVGYCTRQHVAAVRKQRNQRGIWYQVERRGHNIGIYVVGDIERCFYEGNTYPPDESEA